MKAVVQRVSRACVKVEGETVGEINNGLLLLIGFGKDDKEESFKPLIQKIINLRIFSNDKGRFDFSVLDIKGEILAVPQFTLFADCTKGRRPEFFEAMQPDTAKIYFDKFCRELRQLSGLKVESGIFGADMKVTLTNDGPVTILL